MVVNSYLKISSASWTTIQITGRPPIVKKDRRKFRKGTQHIDRGKNAMMLATKKLEWKCKIYREILNTSDSKKEKSQVSN